LVLSYIYFIIYLYIAFIKAKSKSNFTYLCKYPSKINLTKFHFLFFDIQGIATEHSGLCDQSNNEEDQKNRG